MKRYPVCISGVVIPTPKKPNIVAAEQQKYWLLCHSIMACSHTAINRSVLTARTCCYSVLVAIARKKLPKR